MPYSVRKRGSKWLTVNRDTGKVKGTHGSKSKAQKQAHLLRGIDHGWNPTRRRGG